MEVKKNKDVNLVEEEKTLKNSDHDYADSTVPLDKRKSMWELSIVTLGMVYGPITMITAKVWAEGFGFWQGRLVNFAGLCITLLIIAISSGIGAKEGLPASVLIRKTMGTTGAKIFGIAIGVGFLGWFGVQTGFFTSGIIAMFPQLNYSAVAFIGGLLMMTTAIVGYKAISLLSKIAIPMIWVWLAFGLIKVISITNGDIGSALNSVPLGVPMTVMQGIVLTVGQTAVGASTSADIYRYMRPRESAALTARDAVISNGLAFLGSIPILAVFTMIINTSGTTDFGAIMGFAGGWVGIVVLALLAWTTNDNNLYSSALAWKALFPKSVKKYQITIIIGIVGSIIAAMNILGEYITFLSVLSSMAPPAMGILGADYFILPHLGIPAFHFEKTGKSTNVPAVISWACGSTLMLISIFTKYVIPFAPIFSITVAGIIYIVLVKAKIFSNYNNTSINQ